MMMTYHDSYRCQRIVARKFDLFVSVVNDINKVDAPTAKLHTSFRKSATKLKMCLFSTLQHNATRSATGQFFVATVLIFCRRVRVMQYGVATIRRFPDWLGLF